MKKSSPGFTLFELIVAIASAAMVLTIALSFLLLGMRMENRTSATAARLQTTRVVLTMAEKLAVSGDIDSIQYIGSGDEVSWVLRDKDGGHLLQYLASDGTLRLGSSILMGDLKSASATLSYGGRLFTLTIETQDDEFSTTVYCRNGKISSIP